MPPPTRILVVGDRDPAMYTHRAIDDALEHLVGTGRTFRATWLHTNDVTDPALTEADGVWLAPKSPYASTSGALAAIRFARERRVPFLGICGGFQHTVLEFVRNVLGDVDAAHAETQPDAPLLAITPLECSLVGKAGVIFFEPDSLIAVRYGRWRAVERYHCNYGVNEAYVARLGEHGLRVVGRDDKGEVRAMEMPDHPFFIATLFQPQLASTPQDPAPLVRAFVDAASAYGAQRVGHSGATRPHAIS